MAIGIGSAVLLTFPVGWIADKVGPKKAFLLVASFWGTALILGSVINLEIAGFVVPEWLVYVMGVIVGPAMGGTWVSQRQMLAELAPKEKVSNYFGVANVFGRISSAVGPALWAGSIAVLQWLDFGVSSSIRVTLIVVGGLMFTGLWLIQKTTDLHEHYVRGARHIGDGIWRLEDGTTATVDEIKDMYKA